MVRSWISYVVYLRLEQISVHIIYKSIHQLNVYVEGGCHGRLSTYYFLGIYSFPSITERLENLQLGVHFTWVVTNCPSSCFTACFTTAVISCIVVLVKVYLRAVAYIELVCWKKCILFDLRNKDSLFDYYEVGLYDIYFKKMIPYFYNYMYIIFSNIIAQLNIKLVINQMYWTIHCKINS